jgi:hypothetical protein
MEVSESLCVDPVRGSQLKPLPHPPTHSKHLRLLVPYGVAYDYAARVLEA